tara:strand:- start:4433 stop:4894 length:462 start_codon:yes stop_codon:yes gene_type:complete
MAIKKVLNPLLISKLILGYLTFFAPPPVNKYLLLIRGVKFNNIFSTWIGFGSLFDNRHPELIEIGKNVVISSNVKILSHTEPPLSFKKYGITYTTKKTKISSNVYIGAGSTILPGITINEFCIIGAGSVVTKDVPNHCIFAGNPAKLIKKIDQ